MTTLLALALSTAYAGDDYRAAAEEYMGLSFDLDTVQGMLREKKSPAPAAAAPRYDAYGQSSPQPIPSLPLEPNSTLDGVVVYRDRALVTRYRDVHVAAGASSVVFEGLPLGLAVDSLNAQARQGDFRVVGVELLSGAGKVEETERIGKIRDDMKGLTEDLGQVRDHVEALLAERAYLRGALVGGQDRPQPTVDQLKGTMAYVGDAEGDIASKLRAEQQKAKDLDEKLSPLLIKLANPLATGMTVRVDLDATKAADVEIGLRYQVFGARWWPSYNARLDDASGRVDLEYYGMVAQSTGEDWTNASLLLSTADPSISGSLPLLQAWYLGRDGYGYGGGISQGLDAGRGMYNEPGNDGMIGATPSSGVLASDMSATVKGSGAVAFAIPGRKTIKGDGSEQRLPVGTQTFQSQIELATVPKVVTEVYRSARFQYAGEAPILPGTVSSFVGSDFVGTGEFGATVPGEDLLVGFGADPSFKVTRTLVSRQEESVGAKKMVRYTLHFRIDVQNFGKTERSVVVTDQVPVSQIEHVTVERLDGTPSLAPEPRDPEGLTRWNVGVAPGGKQTIELAFSVTAPREIAQAQAQQLQQMYEMSY